MTDQEAKEKLALLEKEWVKAYRRCKKYRLLLKGAEEYKDEIEKAIQEL